MSRSVRARWWNALAVAAAGLVLCLGCALLGPLPVAAIPLVAGGVLAWLVSPLHRPPRSVGHWDAQARLVSEGAPIIYWRPGSPLCLRLRLRLGSAARAATWVDVWDDPAGAAFVRDLNGGTEAVPTVILRDGTSVTRPAPEVVLDDLAA